jgi:ATP-dependent DNA ligase
VEHHENAGVELFRAACAADLEGLVAKRKDGLYTPESPTWVKIKNRDLPPGCRAARLLREARGTMMKSK